jgi:two-component sensor histidine kinase
MIVELLSAEGINAEIRVDPTSFEADLPNCAAAIITIEALSRSVLTRLQAALAKQPPWSDVPIILLAGRNMPHTAETLQRSLGNLTIVQRPLQQSYLVSMLNSALRARRRQYEVRDLLEETLRQHKHIEALNESLRRAMTETHHRVKNNLQVVAAMVDLQTLQYEENVPASEVKRMAGQVRTLAAVHDILTATAQQNQDTQSISSKTLLEALLNQLESVFPGRQVEADIQDIELTARQSTALALITNELFNNALKHGSDPISVTLACDERSAKLTVADAGRGFPPTFDPAKDSHTGLDLICMLSRWDLDGSINFENGTNGGACIHVTFPRSKVASLR